MYSENLMSLSQNAANTQKLIRFEKDMLESLKEEIKNEYMLKKEEAYALDEDFIGLNINGVLLQEKKNPTYTWLDDFYDEAVDCGLIHTLLKNGDKLKERFNLDAYILPKNPDNKSLGLSPVQKTFEELTEEEKKMEEFKSELDRETLEQKVERYMRYKKLLALKEDKYNIQKKQLLQAMKEENVQKTQEGFYLKEEQTQLDFKKMYKAELEELVVIATNGAQSVDLFNDKKIVMTDVTEDDLHNVESIKKRFGAKRLSALKEALGDNFYFIQGYRTEKDILRRFPVSTEKVEEAVDNGFLPSDILKSGRIIKDEKDLKLSFEIISEESAIKRAEMNYAKYMAKALKHSGYYDN